MTFIKDTTRESRQSAALCVTHLQVRSLRSLGKSPSGQKRGLGYRRRTGGSPHTEATCRSCRLRSCRRQPNSYLIYKEHKQGKLPIGSLVCLDRHAFDTCLTEVQKVTHLLLALTEECCLHAASCCYLNVRHSVVIQWITNKRAANRRPCLSGVIGIRGC